MYHILKKKDICLDTWHSMQEIGTDPYDFDSNLHQTSIPHANLCHPPSITVPLFFSLLADELTWFFGVKNSAFCCLHKCARGKQKLITYYRNKSSSDIIKLMATMVRGFYNCTVTVDISKQTSGQSI